MEKKNKRLMILAAILLVTIGASLAYFTSSVTSKGSGSLVDVTTTVIKGAELKVEGTLNFSDTGIYSGHKNISSVKVTATGNNELIPYNLIWSGTNTINTSLNYTVYKTSSEINVNANCTKKTEITSNGKELFEECTISNIDTLGDPIANGTINNGDTKATLVSDEFITSTPTGDIKYYYIVLEYSNIDISQNTNANGTINGKIKAEESNTKPNINVLAAYIKQDNGEYIETSEMPSEGYVINTSKSACSNGATPTGTTPNITINNLNKSGTSCYLYFDVKKTTIDDIIASIEASSSYKGTTAPDFSQTAIGAETDANNGIYATTDGMYDNGTTYYWRGAATTNHVIFADKCWRIVRINGDKTMRLIYNGRTVNDDGKTCANFGSGAVVYSSTTSDRYYATSDGQYNNASYVGWTYILGSQRTLAGTASNAKNHTEKWYDNNIGNNATYSGKVADGKYCNDRNMKSGSSFPDGGTGSTTQYYAGYGRLVDSKSPTFNCPSGDVYTLKVGAITADEVAFAGGVYGQTNESYYLKGDNHYWTMSPYYWNSGGALVFRVNSGGGLSASHVSNTNFGLRPVINLKSDTTFASNGTGQNSNPYVVND